MLHARLVCSDGDCAALYEAVGPSEEVEALSCDCGAWLQPVGLSVAAGHGGASAAAGLSEPLQ